MVSKSEASRKIYRKILAIILLLAPFTQKAEDYIQSFFEKFYTEKDTTLVAPQVEFVKTSEIPKIELKDWTIILYISADNDLSYFAIRNI